MVDVSSKMPTIRTATATGRIYLPRAAYELVSSPTFPAQAGLPKDELEKAKEKARAKGDVLVVAQLAAMMASKRTADLIPLCHPIPLSHVAVTLQPEDHGREASEGRRLCILCEATITCEGRTGVEMEALTVSLAQIVYQYTGHLIFLGRVRWLVDCMGYVEGGGWQRNVDR